MRLYPAPALPSGCRPRGAKALRGTTSPPLPSPPCAGQSPQQGNGGEASGASGASGGASSKQPRPKAQARHRLTEDNFYQV